MRVSNRIEDILEFWFGHFPGPYEADASKRAMWFRDGAAWDQTIFMRFGADFARAVEGELDDWAQSHRGALALVIVLDQFSRHIHRGHAEAFAQDEKARQICIEGIGAGLDAKMHPVERGFFYMPLEHAEDADTQALAVRAFEQLVRDVPEAYRQYYARLLSFARAHQYVIERFGRFPELNAILGRESTPEEEAFLASGKYRFL